MRLVRLLAALTVLGGLAFAVPASAHVNIPPPAAGTTVITAAHSGWRDLTLTDDARIAPEGGSDIAISGAGRMIGFYLYRIDGAADSVLALRLPKSAGGRIYSFIQTTGSAGSSTCTSWPNETVPVQQNCNYTPVKSITLHQGFYRLAVLTDGAPVRIVLRLHGLAGRRHLGLTTAAPSVVAPMTVLANPTGQLARALATVSVKQQSLVVNLVVGKWQPKPNVFGSYGCYYDGGDPVGAQMLPNCPGGSGAGGDILDPQHEAPAPFFAPSIGETYGAGPGSLLVGQGLEDDQGVTVVDGLVAAFATPAVLAGGTVG